MYAVRRWSVTHARFWESVYAQLERVLVKLVPWIDTIGYERVEKPVVVVEKAVKSFLFDCQMCGQCVLSSTGMSCPMNCPKTLRNGPCGGVRADGCCEVQPEMTCVWLEAERGARKMRESGLHVVQFAVDHRLKGRSSWLRTAKEVHEAGRLDQAQARP